jgi:hypothetical protein
MWLVAMILDLRLTNYGLWGNFGMLPVFVNLTTSICFHVGDAAFELQQPNCIVVTNQSTKPKIFRV